MPPTTQRCERRYSDGRDELNLADFPISVLQRQQPVDANGAKLDSAVYESSRYDRKTRQRLRQRVTLETSSRHGLPTPADENVILALLHVAKHSHNFAEPVVRFTPRQLFDIMGWAPNSRSYDRLRDVLRRLKALVIRYENSWWDIAGRSYEAEVATGIVSEYELGRQTGGRRKGGSAPSCWVCWTPHFQRSLGSGNLKKLDLERLFSLKLPTSQRMYRFLDKRFYPPHQPPEVDMDLTDFACGHVGLSRVDNVAELKRRLAPAIAELEAIGFLEPAGTDERFNKVRAGVWRVRFRAGPEFLARNRSEPVAVITDAGDPEEETIVAAFYRLWSPDAKPGDSDRKHARDLLEQHGPETAHALVPLLVQVLRRGWPECKTFSGAVQKYLPEALRLHTHKQRRQEESARAKEQGRHEDTEAARLAERRRLQEARWQELTDEARRQIEDAALRKNPGLKQCPAILHEICLNRLDDGRQETLFPEA